jgi:30S ribosomal protein S31
MGKGDKKSKKGKRTIGSSGNSRPRKKKKALVAPKATATKAKAAAKEKVKKEPAEKKAPAKKAAPKKEKDAE